jgi:hypothetical protein
MKKVAFILAIALIFLVGITTVLKHKLSAGTTEKAAPLTPAITPKAWIPIDEEGNVVFNQLRSTTPNNPPTERGHIGNYSEINPPITITIQKVKKNPYCFWITQGGVLKEVCY